MTKHGYSIITVCYILAIKTLLSKHLGNDKYNILRGWRYSVIIIIIIDFSIMVKL